ncbi:MAG: fused MFS/spermidine synthase [Bacteroidetes bacterium]|nr:fused MFS/spermidine synthase [Bacteroidota bacterium]
MNIKIESGLKYSVIILGISAITTQIILLREFLSVFYGNELIMGILLSNWMLLTGIGAYLGKTVKKIKEKLKLIYAFQIVISILPVVTVFSFYLFHNIAFVPGKMFGPVETWLIILVLLLPYCLVSGALFTIFSIEYSNITGRKNINKVYGLEAIGSIIGGLIFNFLLVFFLKTFQSLFLLLLINMSSAFILSSAMKKPLLKYLAICLAIVFLIPAFLLDPDKKTRELLYPDQEIILYEETPYGKIDITEIAGQKNFYDNGSLLFTSYQPLDNEEIIHYAMVQHPKPEKVLLISGGLSGTTKEILKYNIKQVDYVEMNPWLLDLGKEYTSALDDKIINSIGKDPRRLVKQQNDIYDIVIIDLPDPSTAQINRLYTYEFFKEVKKVLKTNGILSTNLVSAGNYMSQEAIMIHSVLLNTLKKVFNNVIIIPGTRDYYIASDEKITYNIVEQIILKNIDNIYVNEYYLDDELTRLRAGKIMESLDPDTRLNTDFKPLAYYEQILYWLSHFKINIWLFLVLLLVPVIFVFIKSNAINIGLFASGFTGSSVTFILLISFQVIYGYVYQMIGIIITLFMAGLALGSLVFPRLISPGIKKYYTFQFIIGVFAIILSLLMISMSRLSMWMIMVNIIFNLLSLISGILIGFQYAQATILQRENVARIASSTYSIDLLGSAIGALAAAIFLIPLTGIINTCFFIGIINILAGLIVLIKTKSVTSDQ